MYLYFDVNGNLKEFINYPVREGDDNVNKIYVYMEPSTNKSQRINKADYSDYNFENEPIEDYVDVLILPSIYNSWDALFKISDSDVILNDGILLGDNISDSYVIKQIPYDKERDLKYFAYSKYYKFIEITLTSSITQYNGRCDCTVSMLNDDPERIKKLDVFSFFIQESVVLKDVNITMAQYEYLYNITKTAEDAVPYEGATQDVNLGDYGLSAGDITLQKDTSSGSKLSVLAGELSQANSKIELNIDDTTYANADITVSDAGGTVHYCSNGIKKGSNNLYFPVLTSESDEFAVKSKTVPYTGADDTVDLGENILIAHQITATDHLDVTSSNRLYEENGDLIIETDDGDIDLSPNNKATYNGKEIATQEWVISRHNGIYDVSSDFFPSDSNSHTISLDEAAIKDIAENATVLVHSYSGQNSSTWKSRYPITYCDSRYDSSNELTSTTIIYTQDWPNNSSGYSYVEFKVSYKFEYVKDTYCRVTRIANVDNS